MVANLFSRAWVGLKRLLFVSRSVRLGDRVHIGILSYVSAPRSLTVGSDVYIGKFCSIQCNGFIGDSCLIANNVGIVGRRDHDFKKIGMPMSRAPWVGGNSYLADDPRNSITVGADVWVGFGAVLLTGITVGRGAIIAAGSVVTGDVPPYAIMAGNPARQVGNRFDESEIEHHEALIRRES